jgi:glutamyl/glutaminyl-tRNA synthetase
MASYHYELLIPELSKLNANALRTEIGGEASIVEASRQEHDHMDPAMVTLAMVLGSKVLEAMLSYFSRRQTSKKFDLRIKIRSPDGTMKDIILTVNLDEHDAPSDQALKQIANALGISPAELKQTP